MPLSGLQLAELRALVGSVPDDDALNDRFELVGSVARTALSILETRLADARSNPDFRTADYSETRNEHHIKALEAQVARAQAAVTAEELGVAAADPRAVVPTSVGRSDRSRLFGNRGCPPAVGYEQV